MRHFLFAGPAFSALMIASCAAPPPPPAAAPKPAAAPTPAPATVPVADWRDAPLTPGRWRYGNREASFGMESTLLTIACDVQARTVSFHIPTVEPLASNGETIEIMTSFGSVIWPAIGSQSRREAIAKVSALDPFLDKIAYSRGRFMIQLQRKTPKFILPAWPEVSRLIDDCRG